MKKPSCKECEAKGDKYSVVAPMSGMTTLLAYNPGYWDEDGNYHINKDPNTTTYVYSCNHGHSWIESN